MTEISCDVCGKSFNRSPSEIGEHNFCSTGCQNKWQSEYQSGEGNPMYLGGRMVSTECEECGETVERYKSKLERCEGTFCSEECASESFKKVPEDAWHFYRSAQWVNKREEIRDRDGNECCWCGNTDRLEVHHLNPISNGGGPLDNSNLCTLCVDCHNHAHRALKV